MTPTPSVSFLPVRRIAAGATVLALAVAGLVSVPISAQAAAPIDFTNNDALRNCLLEELNASPSVVLYPSHLATLNSVSCEDEHVVNLLPLKSATNLTSLDLSGNDIVDLTPLASLTKLDDLDLQSNTVSSVAALHNLNKLTYLDISENTVTSILPLAGLPLLQSLVAMENPLIGIGPVLDMPSLVTLGVGSWAASTPLDLTALTSMPDLQQLAVNNPRPEDLTAVSNHPKLNTLFLRGGTLTSVSTLTGVPNLQMLDLSDNALTDASPLAVYSDLSQLNLRGNHLSNVDVVAQMHDLTVLLIASNRISSLPTFAALTKLVSVSAETNQISDLTPLASSPSLKFLLAQDNRISNVAPLAQIPTLEGALLDRNAISDLSPISGVSTVKILSAADQVVDLPAAIVNVPSTLPVVATSAGKNPALTITKGAGEIAGSTVTWSAPGSGSIAWKQDISGSNGVMGVFSGTIAQASVNAPVAATPPPGQPAAVALQAFAKKLTVKLAGSAKVGKKLSAKVVKPAAGVTLTYQWFRNGHAIKKATKSTFTVTKASKKTKITVRVTASKTGFITVTAKSKASSRVR